MSRFSRRSIVTSAASLPALAVPAVAGAVTPASTTCTLPPDLIERVVRVRARYLEYDRQCTAQFDEINGHFHAATDFTTDQWRSMGYGDPRIRELGAVHRKICAEISSDELDAEGDALSDERSSVVETIMEHEPQTIADLAWQAEAFVLTESELLCATDSTVSLDTRLIQTLFNNIRALGAIPQPIPLAVGPDPYANYEIVDAVTDTVGQPDPAFAAVKECERSWAELCEKTSALSQAADAGDVAAKRNLDELLDAAFGARETLLEEVTPTTVAGVVAVLRYVADIEGVELESDQVQIMCGNLANRLSTPAV
jgi:hypothetical protein